MPINIGDLINTPLFKEFWTSETEGMSHRGLDEVTPEGVRRLAEFALKHEADGAVSQPDQQTIDDTEKAIVKAILEHEHYGTFFEQDALAPLYQKFGLDPGAMHAHAVVTAPVDAGSIEIPANVSRVPRGQLERLELHQLGEAFGREYESRRDFFEDPRATKNEKGKRILGLLRDYSEVLWRNGERGYTEWAGKALLKEFFTRPFAKVFGATDYNGFGVGAAQALVLGQDPNEFKTKFPKAYPTAETTYLAMNGAMAPAMSHVDKYREAKGLEPAAEALEKAPYLGYMIGEESGHTKHGSLSESSPFSSSGVNWGKVIFVGDREIAALPPKQGFEFPIDCVDAYNQALRCLPSRGERIEVRDQAGKKVEVEKVIHKDADGKPVSWSAKFLDTDGNELQPSQVIGVIVDRSGRVKGDGKTTGSVNMWWYGFCDRNTAQKLYKSRFHIPQLDRDVIKIKAGDKTIEVPKTEAQMLVDCDIPDLVTGESMCGFRFNDEPQTIMLKDGSRLQGRVHSKVLDYGPGASRIGEDMLLVHDAPGRPLLGTLELTKDGSDRPTRIDVGSIASFSMVPGGDTVTITMKEGVPDSFTAKLSKAINWSKAENQNGTLVLKQADELPIRGELTVNMPDGSTKYIPCSDIQQIAGEIEDDLRISQYMTWISKNDGMFATDNSKGVVVSNGMRWVNRLELDERTGDERPKWAPAADQPLKGIEGDVKREDGDKIIWVRARYGSSEITDINSTQFAGWMQIKDGAIVNEGFTNGAPDFGWGALGKLDWRARSSFNPHMEPDMRLQLLINGVASEDKLQALADAGNLPGDWRKYKVPQDPTPDPVQPA